MATVWNGTGGNDFTSGTDGDDVISTGAGRDWVDGSGGNDSYVLGYRSSASYLRWGFEDYDMLSYRNTWTTMELPSAATLYVVADLQAGTVRKYEGATLVGTDTVAGVDGMHGTDASDRLLGRNFWQYEEFHGYGGDDVIDGRGNEDWVNYASATTAGIAVDLRAGTVTGTDAAVGTDTLRQVEGVVGTSFDDVFDALGYGRTGANRSSFGEDWNLYAPQGGNDTVTGNGATTLSLGGVAGRLNVNLGLQTALGVEAGITFTAVTGATGYQLGTLTASGLNGVLGGNHNDVLVGGGRVNTAGSQFTLSGDASFEWFRGNAGNDTIRGQTGYDRADYRTSAPMTEGIVVQLAQGRVEGDGPAVGVDALRGIESVRGTYLDDVYDARGFTLTNAGTPSVNAGDVQATAPAGVTLASRAYNEFVASGGNDVVTGNGATRVTLDYYVETMAGVSSRVVFTSATAGTADFGLTDGGLGRVAFTGTFSFRGSVGHDDITGASGYQQLLGGYGNDTIRGSGGDDMLFGHTGGDKAALNYSTTFTDNDSLDGGSGNDLLRGDFGNDVLQGGTGADTMEGGTGNDTFHVDNTGDVVTELGSGGTDTVYSSLASYALAANVEIGRIAVGTAANLTGNGSANTLVGGAGANTLAGAMGADTLAGGGGNDRFVLRSAAESGITSSTRDVIQDFRPGDKIVLSGIDANTATATNDAFSGTLVTSFTRAGQLRFDATTGILYGNTDADTAAEFSIQLTGVGSLSTTDFVL